MIILRCFQDILFKPDIDKLLHLVIKLLSSLLENRAYVIAGLVGILFNMLDLICQLCAELKD